MSNPTASPLRHLLGLKEAGKAGRILVWDTAEISVGRAPENDLVLDDSDASRRHAIFLRTAQGHMVQDLGTSNGTRVNGSPVSEPRLLENKDVVQIGEVQLTFIQTRKDPSALGLEVIYSSSLKDFTHPAAGVDPGATTLGLTDPVAGSFDVGSVGDFAGEPEAEMPTRDLDLEFNDFVPGGVLPSASGSVSLQLEIEGLTPELAQRLQALLGKVIELPGMRIRIKSG